MRRPAPIACACSASTPTPTTKRRRGRERRPATPPRACTPCWSPAPAARPARSSTRRPTPPRPGPTWPPCGWPSWTRASGSCATRRSTCSATADSGMPDSEDNARPDSFAAAPLDEAVGRLVAIIRAERPQVILTYGDDHTGLPAPRPHPGPRHLRWSPSTPPATPTGSPRPGAPFQPSSSTTRAGPGPGIEALHEAFLDRGEESPYEKWLERWKPDDEPPDDHPDRRGRATSTSAGPPCWPTAPRSTPSRSGCACPRTSCGRSSPGRSTAWRGRWWTSPVPDGGFEDDLFAGLRAEGLHAARARREGSRPCLQVPRARNGWTSTCKLAESQPVRPGATARIQYVDHRWPRG